MSEALHIAVSEEKGNVPVTILLVSGDLDSKTYQELEAKASELIGGGAKNILLDLSGVRFMGSAGLRAMHGISNKLKNSGGGQLKLLSPSDAVSRVMFTLGFDKFFDIKSDLNEAVKSF
jgi:anti-sigma B factor antagonist